MSQFAKSRQNARGFTLIELMLSMTFVAVLLLAIAMSVIQMANIYNRGMTLKEVNQVARDFSEDIRRTVAGSKVFIVNTDGLDSNSYVTIRHAGKVTGGRLCTGSASYVWNSAYAIERRNEITSVAKLGGPNGEPVRLFKIADPDKVYCMKGGADVTHTHIRAADVAAGAELLKSGDRALGLQEFKVTTSEGSYDPSIEQRTYTVQYRIGTGETQAMNETQTACLDPSEDNSNWTYCNVQQFDILVRAGNTVDR